jgi:POT family proton-dependent oligopeptide transporter
MDTTIKTDAAVDEVKRDTSGIAGHPRGLMVLFFTEFWERFSFYGMRALLVLYMTHAVADGGLAFNEKKATSIVGTYLMAVYLMSLPGGWIADQFLGAKLAVLVGGMIIAAGHFSMAFPSLVNFYAGLILISIGTGFLKPNISAMVGGLYGENDSRRDSGFSIFYMGINFGASVAPFACGFLAQSATFRNFLASMGFDPLTSWHWGFAAAGVGMLFGLTSYLAFRQRLAHVGLRPQERRRAEGRSSPQALTPDDWKRIAAIFVFFIFSIVFWGVYEQAASSFSLFADLFTRNEIFGRGFPPSYFQAPQAIFVIVLSPVFAWLWLRLGRHEPSSPAKFAYGLFFVAISVLLMVPASLLAASGRVSPLWLLGVYFVSVLGELCLSPVGLSTVTKLAPVRFVGIMMGVWFVSIALGEKLAGFLAGFFSGTDTTILARLFGYTGLGVLVATAVLVALTPWVRRLMGKVH